MRPKRRLLWTVAIAFVTATLLVIMLPVPFVTADQAVRTALTYQGGPSPAGWHEDRTVFSRDGRRPTRGILPPADAAKCFGPGLLLGDVVCLPYPIWKIHLVGPRSGSDCQDALLYVDGRQNKVVLYEGQTGPCAAFTSLS